MSWFSKVAGARTLDLTNPRNKRLLEEAKKIEDMQNSGKAGDLGFVDFSSQPSRIAETKSKTEENPFGFNLGSFDSSSNTTSVGSIGSQSTSQEGYGQRLREARKGKLAEFKGMKNKIDDLEYKLERMMEKIAKMENKLLGLDG